MDRLLQIKHPKRSNPGVRDDDAFEWRTHGDEDTVLSSDIRGCRLVYVIVSITDDQRRMYQF